MCVCVCVCVCACVCVCVYVYRIKVPCVGVCVLASDLVWETQRDCVNDVLRSVCWKPREGCALYWKGGGEC